MEKLSETIKGWKSELLSLLRVDPKAFDLEKVVNAKANDLPKKVYRYRPLREKCAEVTGCSLSSNSERELKNLEDGLIWMSNPKDYNDPFDSVVHFSDSVLLGRLTDEMVTQFSSTLKTPLTAAQIEIIVKSGQGIKELINISASEHTELNEIQRTMAVSKLHALVDDRYTEMLNVLNQIIRNGALACSFSERSDSTLMWSHYASNHTGFCVEYSLIDDPDGKSLRDALYPVIYTNALTDVTSQFQSTVGDKKGIGLTACICKAEDWSYEKEWRAILLFRPNAPAREWKIPKPSKIILGAKVAKEHEARMRTIADKNGINISRVSLSRNSYTMTEEDIN